MKKMGYWNACFHTTVQVWHCKEEKEHVCCRLGSVDRLYGRSHSSRLRNITCILQPGFKSGVQDQAQAIVVNVPLIIIQQCLHR